MECLGIRVINIDKKIAMQAAKVRAEFRDFKSVGALQIVTAMERQCDLFLTNDKQLRQERRIRVWHWMRFRISTEKQFAESMSV